MTFWMVAEQPLRAPREGWIDLPESVPADLDSIQPIYLIEGLSEAKAAGNEQVWATLFTLRVVPGKTPLTQAAMGDLLQGNLFCSGFIAISDLVSAWLGDRPLWSALWTAISLGEHDNAEQAGAEAREILGTKHHES